MLAQEPVLVEVLVLAHMLVVLVAGERIPVEVEHIPGVKPDHKQVPYLLGQELQQCSQRQEREQQEFGALSWSLRGLPQLLFVQELEVAGRIQALTRSNSIFGEVLTQHC